MPRPSSALLVVALLAAAPAARAEEPAPGSLDAHFLVLRGLSRTVDQELGALGRRGGAGLPLGAELSTSFVVGGQSWAISANRTDLRYPGEQRGERDPMVAINAAGVLVAYRSVDDDLFVTATPSLTKRWPERPVLHPWDDVGVALKLAIAKEWWFGHTALGLNGQAAFATAPERAAQWQTGWVGLAIALRFE